MPDPGSLRPPAAAGALAVRAERLDPLVQLLEAGGTLGAATAGELAGRIEAAADTGVRWLVLDLAGIADVAEEALPPLLGAARALHARAAELVVCGAAPGVAVRLAAHGLVVLPSLDRVLMLLKAPPGARPRSKEQLEALALPRLDPA